MRSDSVPSDGKLTPDICFGFIQAPLEALGPGRRVGLWLRGCSLRCPGCVSSDLWEATEESRRPVTDVFSDIKQAYKAHGAVGLTISGGEPFEQAEALRLLLQMCFDDGLTDDILVYSGYDQASLLCRHPWAPKLISALVAGPFDLNLPTRSVWCGSDNQTLAVFKASLHLKYERWRQETSRRMQVIMGSHYIRIIGIPQPEDLEPLGNLIRGAFNEES